MTFEEMKAIANKTTTRKKSRHIESQIQQSCVKWFRLQFPEIGLLLFAVPNGGARNKREAGILKGEGVTAGVADMILIPSSLFPRWFADELKEEGLLSVITHGSRNSYLLKLLHSSFLVLLF